MPLTPSQKSAAFRQRRAEKMARMEAALERLGSMEAFVMTRAVVPGQDDELIARIDYARRALNPGKEMGE